MVLVLCFEFIFNNNHSHSQSQDLLNPRSLHKKTPEGKGTVGGEPWQITIIMMMTMTMTMTMMMMEETKEGDSQAPGASY